MRQRVPNPLSLQRHTERDKEEEEERDKMAPRVGIVATGDRLSHLIPLLHSLHIPVSAIWSRHHDDSCRLATKHGVPLVTRHFQELLVHPEVDVIYVATDPVLRAEVSVKAITSGKHCVSLSPMSVSYSSAAEPGPVSPETPPSHTQTEGNDRFRILRAGVGCRGQGHHGVTN